MAAASVPEWKQSLLKQRQAKEESLKESSTDDKYAGLPAWKRDLLLKKEEEQRKAQQESERPKLIFGGPRPSSSTTDVKLKLATDAPTKEDASPRKAAQPRTPVKVGNPPAPGSPGPASPSIEASTLLRNRIAAMTVADSSPPGRSSSFSRTPSGTPLAAPPTSPGFLPAEDTSQVRSIVRQLVAENKSESQLREKQLRRRSDIPLPLTLPATAASPLPRGASEPALSLSKSPRNSILQSPGKRKPMTRKLSWSDAAAAPLAVVGPTAYYSDSDSEDVPPPSATSITEDEEEATGLALRVHKSLAERMAKSKGSKSPTSPSTPSPGPHDDENQGPLILDENEASMIF